MSALQEVNAETGATLEQPPHKGFRPTKFPAVRLPGLHGRSHDRSFEFWALRPSSFRELTVDGKLPVGCFGFGAAALARALPEAV